MKEWNSVRSERKFLEWKSFRESIENYTLEEKLDNISKFFFSVPIGARKIDFYNPKDWPTPWEILDGGVYCKNTISLLIYHTIKLVDNEIKVDLAIIDDDFDRYIIIIVNGSLVLNYELGKVNKYVDIKDCIKIISFIPEKEIKQIY